MTNEEKILMRETDTLAEHFSDNAVKMAAALYFEDYLECTRLKNEKNKYIALYLQIMSLYTKVDDLTAVRELDATYESILVKAKGEIHNILKNNLHISK